MSRTFLVTGAGSGLGRGLALHFQAAGHEVIATDRVAAAAPPSVRLLDVTSDADVAAKHALLGFAKTIALETADTDITINTICPSYVRTPLVDAQIAAQARAHGLTEDEVIGRIMLDPMPKKAFITVAEVAAAIEYLVGPGARNVTGQTITIDGGWTAR